MQCFVGYLNDEKSGKCVKCQDSQCITCYPSPNICTTCKGGASIANGKCITCVDKNCNQCDGDAKKCINCKSGFGKSPRGLCVKCSASGCTDCGKDATKCQEVCLAFSKSSNCVVRLHTSTILFISHNPSTCPMQCDRGFTLDKTGKSCIKCPENCDFCRADGTCTSCKVSNTAKYGIVNGVCKKCTGAGAGQYCISCDNNPSICSQVGRSLW